MGGHTQVVPEAKDGPKEVCPHPEVGLFSEKLQGEGLFLDGIIFL